MPTKGSCCIGHIGEWDVKGGYDGRGQIEVPAEARKTEGVLISCTALWIPNCHRSSPEERLGSRQGR